MIGCYIFIGIGSVIFLFGLYILFKSKETKSWKPNTGIIKEVKMTYDRDRGSDGGTIFYQCIVEYEYKALKSNQMLTGNKIAIGYLPTDNKKGHLKILETLKSAKAVRIWENPKNENETCISNGVNRNAYFLLTFGLMFILFSLSMMNLAYNKPYPKDKIFKVEIIE